jgi:hypothetical protein
MVNKNCGWRGSKNEWIQSKSNLEFFLHIYVLILGTKQIAVDGQNR